MLPDSLNELFAITGSDDFPSPGINDDELAGLTHALVRQSTILRLVGARFAREIDLNQADFYVLMSVMTASDKDITVTPGYISEHLSLSASTLTSILERLAERELIVRDRDAADKRRIVLYYTEKAAHLAVDFYRRVGRALEPITESHRNEVSQMTDHLNLVAKTLCKSI
ncbi:transcriptional regulator, MarR family [Brevibacterium mcbrellneri ATCC 49030]|uniref:Transcriptional regulator, MarR family n=1 Tax=Brevibacterium mcbrellneri ATCC 49030 TaxID=585530 RepID=D4YLU4_9MICO|nr:MarR family transcriptional regulator [Brevibacterium mcbrellneri]EFG47827.1 transcriptional regulator, MarR family [Brevibacterium mcbrellneri ATCC 49030]